MGRLPVDRPRRAGHERPADHLRLRRPHDPADPPGRRPGVPHRRQLRPPRGAARPAAAPADRRAVASIDVSIQEAAGVTVELANPYWFYPRALVQRQTCRHAQPVPTQSAIFQCADERWVYFALILADQKPWHALVQWMDEPGPRRRPHRPGVRRPRHRQPNFHHVQDLVEVFFLLQDARVRLPRGSAARPADRCAQRARGPLRRRAPRRSRVLPPVDEPGYGAVPMPVRSVPLLDARRPCHPSRPPGSGEHSAEVLRASVQGDIVSGPPSGRSVAVRRRSTSSRSPARAAGRARRSRFPGQASCPRCTGVDVEPHALSTARHGVGVHRAALPAEDAVPAVQGADFRPYAVGYVDLAGEVFVESRLVGRRLGSAADRPAGARSVDGGVPATDGDVRHVRVHARQRRQ